MVTACAAAECEHELLYVDHNDNGIDEVYLEFSINVSSSGYQIEYVCKKCQCRAIVCVRCSSDGAEKDREYWKTAWRDQNLVFCRFIGIECIGNSDLPLRPVPLEENIDEKMEHYAGDYNMTFLPKDYNFPDGLTGPSGGQHTFWKCDRCGDVCALTDK